MTIFKTYDNNVEVSGNAVLAFVAGMGYYKKNALDILKRHGISNPKKGEWYHQQSWLDAFKEVSEGPYTLYSIGHKIPEEAIWPPDIDSLESALKSIDTAYYMNHRGGEIGHYRFYKGDDGALHMECDGPYPCEFDRGIIAGISEKFKPEGSIVTVIYNASGPCREKGNQSCHYSIKLDSKIKDIG